MVTPKMKFYRVKDDIDELKSELTTINQQSKKLYVDIRRENSRKGSVQRKSKAVAGARKLSSALNDDSHFDGEASLLDEENPAGGSKVIKYYDT